MGVGGMGMATSGGGGAVGTKATGAGMGGCAAEGKLGGTISGGGGMDGIVAIGGDITGAARTGAGRRCRARGSHWRRRSHRRCPFGKRPGRGCHRRGWGRRLERIGLAHHRCRPDIHSWHDRSGRHTCRQRRHRFLLARHEPFGRHGGRPAGQHHAGRPDLRLPEAVIADGRRTERRQSLGHVIRVVTHSTTPSFAAVPKRGATHPAYATPPVSSAAKRDRSTRPAP